MADDSKGPDLELQSKSNDDREEDAEENEDQQSPDYEVKTNLHTYITDTFRKRRCIRFVQDPKASRPNTEICCCGYAKDEHKEGSGKSTSAEPWSVEKDTETESTDAFGEIEFPTFGQKNGKYIRVDYQTNVDDLLDLMYNHWGMKQPHLLISVTGGAQNFTMKPQLKEVFRKGLVKAAESTCAWIITGGTNTGVMKHVGDAIRAHTLKQGSKKQLTVVGIATWGCIENKESLVKENALTTTQQLKAIETASYNFKEMTEKKKESPLDPNHTHFILVDNGTKNKFGIEIDLRAKLESKISTKTSAKENYGVSIPIVCIVVEGGKGTIETVKQAIDNGTPVLIVEGSGRAADILAYACRQCVPTEIENAEQRLRSKDQHPPTGRNLWQEIEERVQKEFGKTDEKELKGIVDNIKACMAKHELITVFRLDYKSSGKNIDVAIIKTLLKVYPNERKKQLKLALAWNRIDIVKEQIYTEDFQMNPAEWNEEMFNAIVYNRIEFVKFFLEKGFRLSLLLKNRKIKIFYEKALTTTQQLKAIETDNGSSVDEKKLSSWLKELVDQLFDPMQKRAKNRFSDMIKRMPFAPALPDTTVGDDSDDVAKKLFFWAILTRLQSMAMVFWYEAKENLALALIGHLMLKNLLSKEKDSESRNQLQKDVSFFENLATEVLAECYSSSQQKTVDLLVRKMPSFANITALEIAVQADNKRFLAHQACQNLLTEIWMGRIGENNRSIQLLLSVLFFPVSPFLLKFQKERKAPEDASIEANRLENSNKRKTSKADSSNVAIASSTTSAKSDQDPSYFKRLLYFFEAPIVKFSYNCVSYVVLLLLYGGILLTNFYPTISVIEIFLIAWVFTIMLEEIRQIAMNRSWNVTRKFYNYLADKWNIVDVVAAMTFFIGMTLRFIPLSVCERCFYVSRIILAFNLMTFFFRILHMFSVRRELGPKLVMIGKMMIDLFYFMIILMVFIIAYGIASHVILYPNQPLRIALVRDVLSGAWWSVYGEFNIDEVSGEDCTVLDGQMFSAEDCASMENSLNRTHCPGKEEKCPAIDWLGPILLAVYALITNVMMINLLIAMFSNTFAKVEEIADVVWKVQRYHLVLEYESHPVLPPPLIIFEHIHLLIQRICSSCSSRTCRRNFSAQPKQQQQQQLLSTGAWSILPKRKFRMAFGPNYEKELMSWVSINVEECLLKKEPEEQEEMGPKETTERINQILRKLEEIAETKNYDERLNALEDRLRQISTTLETNAGSQSSALH